MKRISVLFGLAATAWLAAPATGLAQTANEKAALAAFSADALKKAPAKQLFGGMKGPTLNMKARSIGFYAKGCLAGAEKLPIDGPAWQVMRLSRNRNWGHPVLIALVERMAREAKEEDGWNGLLVGDLSQPRGGPMTSGHASHQVGLDADIWLTPMPDRILSRSEHAAAIDKAVVQTHQNSTALTLPVSMSVAGDKLTVTIAANDGAAQPAEVWLCPLSRSVPVAIGRGENHGRTITYTNVVKRWVKLGDWNGKSETFNVPLNDLHTADVDSVAVLVQSGVASAPKMMLGAAQASLK